MIDFALAPYLGHGAEEGRPHRRLSEHVLKPGDERSCDGGLLRFVKHPERDVEYHHSLHLHVGIVYRGWRLIAASFASHTRSLLFADVTAAAAIVFFYVAGIGVVELREGFGN